MIAALAVCETTEVLVIKYQAENPKIQMNFSIWFLSDDDCLLYLVMKNVFPVLIVGFASRLTTVPNRKLYITAFVELLCLVSTFLLLLSNDYQLSLPSFRNLLPNLREAIAAFQLVLKFPMVPFALDPLYYTSAETAATNKAIAAAMPEFVAKTIDNEKDSLRHHAVNLIDNLELLQSSYLRKLN